MLLGNEWINLLTYLVPTNNQMNFMTMGIQVSEQKLTYVTYGIMQKAEWGRPIIKIWNAPITEIWVDIAHLYSNITW